MSGKNVRNVKFQVKVLLPYLRASEHVHRGLMHVLRQQDNVANSAVQNNDGRIVRLSVCADEVDSRHGRKSTRNGGL